MKIENKFDHYDFKATEWLPGQSIDCVIMGFNDEGLKILVLKWRHTNLWALPGGFIRVDESLDDAAVSICNARTGLEISFLTQFYTFGGLDRRKDNPISEKVDLSKVSKEFEDWIRQRFITTGYLSLVDIRKCNPIPDELSDACEWRSISKIDDLIMDHRDIAKKALDHIKIQLNYLPIGIALLPEKFTMKMLQKLYESILGKPLDRGNFQKKMLKLHIFIRHEKQLTGAANKAPYLYSFDKEKYEELIRKGIGFIS